MSDIFSNVYKKDKWGYGSGVGALPLNNIDYIKFVNLFIARNNVRSVIDFGCGDWQFSRFIDWTGIDYTGFEIVEELVAHHQRTFGRDKISFRVFKPDTDLPPADLYLCKDVFQHLPNGLIRRYLDRFKARARYVLITNDDWPAEAQINSEIAEGGWRPVRVDRPPFSETAPVVLSWLVEWGGWKPTRKSTALILGQRR